MLTSFWTWFISPLAALPMAPIELAATVFGLASVWYTVREDIRCWPTGLVMVILYAVVFWQAKLYSDAGLQVLYIGLQVYGWWAWLHGGRDRGLLVISRLSRTGVLVWATTVLAGTAAWGWLMATRTDAALPWWDAYIVVASLAAQWLLARKVLENWALWISVDVVGIGTFYAKELYLTAGLYLVFLGLATAGFLEWWRRQGVAATLGRDGVMA